MDFSQKRILIVGAGLSGATLARTLADAGFASVVIDERPHLAGNCHTSRDPSSGIMIHRYGPHIFHTDDDRIWKFITQFGEFVPYRHQVIASTGGRSFSMPINLLTINQFFNRAMTPGEAREFVAGLSIPNADPQNFEEQALAVLGRELYVAFMRDYTQKQWGVRPSELPASIARRLPIRFSYDANYFHHQRQAIPRNGYTSIVEKMLQHEKIEVRLGQNADDAGGGYTHVFYSGRIDRYFNYQLGKLGYRTLDFEEIRQKGDLQGTPVLNYTDMSVPWTRISEHRHFSPWEKSQNDETVAYREYARDCGVADIPYYPLHLTGQQVMLRQYVDLAESTKGVSFFGRLGSYAYLDMDAAIARALEVGKEAIACLRGKQSIPTFTHRPV